MNGLTAKLNRYLAGHYLMNLLFILLLLLGIIYLFDTVELIRRANKREAIPIATVLGMGLYKLPEVGQIILPFAVLFSAMFTFWQLTRRNELIVVRAAGLSAWQFMAPVIGVAVLAGIIHITLLNPIGAALLSRFETLESKFLGERKSYVTLLREGLWLRQDREDMGHVILRGEDIELPGWQLHDVMALFFDEYGNFSRRIDAKTALLDQQEGLWVFENAISNSTNQKGEKLPAVVLPTNLTIEDLEESFASPETLSLWALPGFINTMEDTGFDATRLKIHFQSLLAQPLLFAAMILLAASVSLRPPRFNGSLFLIIAGLAVGFVVFFMTSFLQALGASHQIPAFLAAWSPALVTFLLGIAVMLNLEDG